MKLKLFFEKNKSDLVWFFTVFTLFLIARLFLFTSITVSGESMMPTLVDNERIIASKVSKIERFDIVSFKAPNEVDKLYIKRVIGLPGDNIEYKNDNLYINCKIIEEPYLNEYKGQEDGLLTKDFTLEKLLNTNKVPENTYFVMGDNRNHSTDSRVIGFIEKEAIVGSSKFAFWPINKIGYFDSK